MFSISPSVLDRYIAHGLSIDYGHCLLKPCFFQNFRSPGIAGTLQNAGSDLVPLGWGLKVGISRRLSGEADAAGHWTTIRVHSRVLLSCLLPLSLLFPLKYQGQRLRHRHLRLFHSVSKIRICPPWYRIIKSQQHPSLFWGLLG